MKTIIVLAVLTLLTIGQPAFAAGGEGHGAHNAEAVSFPKPVIEYNDADLGLLDRLQSRYAENHINLWASLLFLGAIIHAFMCGKINKIAHFFEERHHRLMDEGVRKRASAKPQKDAEDDSCFLATIFHFFGEVEVVFGLWLIPLAFVFASNYGWESFEHFFHGVNFIEPEFVVVIMAIAASRPILRLAEQTLGLVAKIGKGSPKAWWLSILTIAPILGSFITEPAAMTIAALLLAAKFYELKPSAKFAYGTIGLLFVNISVGGTLTHFAAPPVLMVAGKWGWDMAFMAQHFGVWAVGGILVSNLLYLWFFRNEFAKLQTPQQAAEDDTPEQLWEHRKDHVPLWVTFVHLGFLGWTVFTAHTPALFVGGFLFYIGFLRATSHHQNRLSLQGPVLVGFFLAALVVHGKFQGWWIEPVLAALSEVPLFLGSTVLTAFNDNAAITYLASQAPNLGDLAKEAVVAGAVTGGGLTVIANAPNPAGQSILQKFFDGGVSPAGLAKAALIPTLIMALFLMVPRLLMAWM